MTTVKAEKGGVKLDKKRRELSFLSTSPEETMRIGAELAAALVPGDVIALFGELGSGKTVFTKGVCRGLDVVDEVTSPTFTLIHEYQGCVPVYHFDFYRIEGLNEIFELGCEEYFYGEGVCLVEWADKGQVLLPKSRYDVYLKNLFEAGSEKTRNILIRKL
ncbi:MAG: tRNA (adenosine(37)-N6)-threonylcarbamoyltransferase complex ATPase subunit type 1 TsaE [bacterium]